MKNKKNLLLKMVLSLVLMTGFGNLTKGQGLCNTTCGCPAATCPRYKINNTTGFDIPVTTFTLSAIPPWPWPCPSCTPPTLGVPPCDTQATYVYSVWSVNAPCELSDGTLMGDASISYIGKTNCPTTCIEGFAWLGGYTDYASGAISGSNLIPCTGCAHGTAKITETPGSDCFISTLCDPACLCNPPNLTGPPAYTYSNYTIICFP